MIAARRLEGAGGQRMVSQTVAVFHQDQFGADQLGRINAGLGGEGVIGGRRRKKRIRKHGRIVKAVQIIGQRDQGGVQGAVLQPGDQFRRQIFAQKQAQGGELAAQNRQGARQEKGSYGRNDAQPQPSGQGLARTAGGLDQIFGQGEYLAGAGDGLLADGGEKHPCPTPIHHRGAQHLFQLSHAGRQGRLGDVGGFGGSGKRAMLGQEFQIVQLAKGGQQHGLHIGPESRRRKARPEVVTAPEDLRASRRPFGPPQHDECL